MSPPIATDSELSWSSCKLPEIVIRWDDGSAERKSRDHIALVAQLVKDGVLAQSPDLDAWIRQQLQVPNG